MACEELNLHFLSFAVAILMSHGGMLNTKYHVDCQMHKLKCNESDKTTSIATFENPQVRVQFIPLIRRE